MLLKGAVSGQNVQVKIGKEGMFNFHQRPRGKKKKTF